MFLRRGSSSADTLVIQFLTCHVLITASFMVRGQCMYVVCTYILIESVCILPSIFSV
ncbi:hypothetical protein BDV24DRAFT_140607 [Aspergillus arachidicola]|uniref:Uncharacterized protein n=1 Tax=Aspergillus arachidicola TaxID=656916 RepID=A0A5N6XV15_9EURO|nr:hypothetical protein BDV24DRAFT_140607 [Aspergillus arachidicola]